MATPAANSETIFLEPSVKEYFLSFFRPITRLSPSAGFTEEAYRDYLLDGVPLRAPEDTDAYAQQVIKLIKGGFTFTSASGYEVGKLFERSVETLARENFQKLYQILSFPNVRRQLAQAYNTAANQFSIKRIGLVVASCIIPLLLILIVNEPNSALASSLSVRQLKIINTTLGLLIPIVPSILLLISALQWFRIKEKIFKINFQQNLASGKDELQNAAIEQLKKEYRELMEDVVLERDLQFRGDGV